MRVVRSAPAGKKLSINALMGVMHGRDGTDVYGDYHDLAVRWQNSNQASSVATMLRNPEFITYARLRLLRHIADTEGDGVSFGAPFLSESGYEKALDQPLRLWRGGGGKYDPNSYSRPWASFTASRKRADTFSVYDGTAGGRFLNKRRGPYWIVELDCKVRDALLYFDQQGDEEVIVSRKTAMQAKVIVQT